MASVSLELHLGHSMR